jgi:aspartate/methionine/tyrosine aminotransferase
MPVLELQDSIAAYAHAARGAGAVDLCAAVWPGAPFPFVADALRRNTGSGSDYPPAQGQAELREAIASTYGAGVTPGNVTIAPGATGAMLLALAVLARPASSVILLEPGYQLSGAIAGSLGLSVRRVAAWGPPTSEQAWRLDVEAIAAALDGNVSAIIITDPDNPTGGVLAEEDWRDLDGLVRRNGCRLIVDRVYEHYPLGAVPCPTATLLDAGAIVVSSVTKWLHAAGLRVGWVLANTGETEALAQASAVLLGGVATPMQLAVADAIGRMPPDHLVKEAETAAQSRSALVAALAAQGMYAWPTAGGLFLNVPASSLGTSNSLDAWRALLAKGIGGVPSAAFRSSGETSAEAFVRLSFARDPATLEQIRTGRVRTPTIGSQAIYRERIGT